jgi:adenosylhomocysteine nucleosidase
VSRGEEQHVQIRAASDAPSILVCFALAEEARPFRRLAAGRPGLSILVTGVGRSNSERSLLAALSQPARPRSAPQEPRRWPGLVLTCGFAGALQPGLAVGQVVFSADEASGLKPKLLAAGAREVRFHCADTIATTAAAKRALGQATGADAVEMESEIIRRLCGGGGISSATVRVISDPVDEDLPLDFNRLMTADLRLDYAKLAGTILRSPGKIRGLLRLQKQTGLAARKLAEVLDSVVAGLAAAG